ncbi:hypothetical protein AB7849_15250 [Rhodanobacter sp. 115]|uniref:hypothetical protein n=1 Tax=Rhodanobacter sp. FW021-MT20 TaxID=1162282 RepID=UPI0034E4A0E0
MAEARTTLTLYPALADFVESQCCSAAGPSVSKRLNLLVEKYNAMMETAFSTRERLTSDEWVALDRMLTGVDFTRASDPAMIPAFVQRARNRGDASGETAAGRLAFKIEQAPVATLFAIADVIERFRLVEPKASNRTTAQFEAFVEEAGLDVAAPKRA